MENTLNDKAERVIKRILNNEVRDRSTKKVQKLSDKQLKTLKDFYEHYKNKPSRTGYVKVRTLELILKQIRKLGLFIKKPYEDITQQDLKDFFRSLDGTNNNMKLNIAIFLKKLGKKSIMYEDEDVLINEMKQVKTESTRTHETLLTKDEVKRMIEISQTFRMKTIVALPYEAGLRAGELCSLNIKDVEFDKDGAKVWVRESKTKKRFVRVIDCVPFLEQYIKTRNAEPDDPLFVSESRIYGALPEHKNIRLQSSAVTGMLQRIADKAGIKKKVFAHLLRHSAVTNLHNQGMDTILSAKRHGISRKTLEEVYLHSSDVDVEKAYLKARGVSRSDEDLIKEKKEKEKLSPKECVNCGHINPFNNNYCDECKRPVDLKTFIEKDNKQEQLLAFSSAFTETLMDNPNASVADVVKKMQEKIKEK